MPPTVTDFEQQLIGQLNAIREQNLFRQLRRVESPQGPRVQVDGRELLNFSSNDYLGLADHPALKEAARHAVDRFGAGSWGLTAHLRLAGCAPRVGREIGRFKGAQAALVFSSGYAAAVGTLGALMEKDDVVIIDKLVHASIVDGAATLWREIARLRAQ
jgi:7-keto-8-aminopelargonate synthetase-like enzyme